MAYDEVLAGRVREVAGSGLVEKRMFGGLAFLLGGTMAVGVHGDDLMVAGDVLDDDVLGRWVDRGMTYAGSLPPT